MFGTTGSGYRSRVLGDKSVLADLSKVRKWNNVTKTGDLTECIELAEDSPILPQLTSTAESCLEQIVLTTLNAMLHKLVKSAKCGSCRCKSSSFLC